MNMGKEHRRKPRHAAAGWSGRYRLQDAAAWRECTLVDISESGAGFQAYMLATDALPLTTAELELVDESRAGEDPIRLRGRVRHPTRSEEGHVRVGIEFVGLTQLEMQLLGMLFDRDAARRARPTLARA
jgi:PilZ domain